MLIAILVLVSVLAVSFAVIIVSLIREESKISKKNRDLKRRAHQLEQQVIDLNEHLKDVLSKQSQGQQ